MEQDDWFAEAFPADAGDTATDVTPEGDAAPEYESSPDEQGNPADSTELPVTEYSDDAVASSTPPVAETQSPPPVDWNHPELAAVRQEAERMQALRTQLAQVKQQQMAKDYQQRIVDMADGDPERVQQLNAMIAQAVTPAIQQSQAIEHRATSAEKALTAFVIAAKAELPDAQAASLFAAMESLMSVDGPDVMERTAYGKRDARNQRSAELAAKDAEIDKLRTHIAAQAQLVGRQASGADVTDGGGGSTPTERDDRMAAANDFDDWFKQWTAA